MIETFTFNLKFVGTKIAAAKNSRNQGISAVLRVRRQLFPLIDSFEDFFVNGVKFSDGLMCGYTLFL